MKLLSILVTVFIFSSGAYANDFQNEHHSDTPAMKDNKQFEGLTHEERMEKKKRETRSKGRQVSGKI